eukprot:7129139-Ditylum_brightwellii.AAC.2
MSLSKAENQLENVVTLLAILGLLCHHLEVANMMDCFFLVISTGSGTVEPQTIDLLTHYGTLLLDNFKISVKVYHTYRYKFDIKNLKWSKD